MYLYEMHQHTAPCSACGRADPEKTVFALKEAGFAGMVLTNHFYHGNTGIDRFQPWEDFVSFYESDYLTAKAAGDKVDFDVLFGVEEHVGKGKEVLLYGITPEFLYDSPFLRDAGLQELSRAVHNAGGLVFQAHPYRDRPYVTDPDENLPIELLDGFETYNAFNRGTENPRAARYAEQNGLLVSAGTDAHDEVVFPRFGIDSPCRIPDAATLVRVLTSREHQLYVEE